LLIPHYASFFYIFKVPTRSFKMKLTYVLSEIDSIAAQIIERTKSTVLLFDGDMGVGKTTLITALAKQNTNFDRRNWSKSHNYELKKLKLC